MMCGGTSSPKEANDEVQALCDQVRQNVEDKLKDEGIQVTEFKAIQHKTQVVAGLNYFVKVHIGSGNHVHLRIYKNLQQIVELSNLQSGKTLEEELAYF